MPASNLKKAIAQILLDEGYIKSFQVVEDGTQGVIRIALKYLPGKEKVITGLRRVSKPGLRVYAGADEPAPRPQGPRHRHHFHIQGRHDRQEGESQPRRRRSPRVCLVRRRNNIMSRIGKMPITVPAGVEVTVQADNVVTVKGPKGTLTKAFHPDMIIQGRRRRPHRGPVPTTRRQHRSLHGLTPHPDPQHGGGRDQGLLSKELDVNGVGYRVAKQGKQLVMNLGYSHQVFVDEIDGITIDAPTPNKIVISGIDKQVVGQFAAEVRGKRPPEPYKGKGIKYTTEVIRRKEGKTGGKK